MPSSIVTSKGQITIPLEVRQRLGLETGHRVDFVEMEEGRYALIAATVDLSSLRGSVARPKAPVSVEEMNRTVRQRAGGRPATRR